MKWRSVKRCLPIPNLDVLVHDNWGGMEVKHLMQTTGLGPGGQKVIGAAWYPSGRPIENTQHWSELPKAPRMDDKCPDCGKKIDANTSVTDGSEGIPDDDDVGVCFNCGQMLWREEAPLSDMFDQMAARLTGTHRRAR